MDWPESETLVKDGSLVLFFVDQREFQFSIYKHDHKKQILNKCFRKNNLLYSDIEGIITMFGKIHEVYSSISGEGISQGIPTVFIRFAGCSLRCGKTESRTLWCDTAYALGPNQGSKKV